MATVKFLQVTDMSAIPTTTGGGGGASSTSEADYDAANDFHYFVSGSFQFANNQFSGTATQMLIDTNDFGSFPNLDFTDFAFFSSSDVGDRLAANPAQFVADVLSGDDTVMGSAGSDTIRSYNGNDILNGGLGADTMIGGNGDDWYFVDNANDAIVDVVGQGTLDRVFASASYNLTAVAQIEIISTANQAGTEGINLRGNEFTQTIVGNAGSNIISGGQGNDSLVGLGGNDYFLFEQAPSNGNADYVYDFAAGQDHIMLQQAGVYSSLGIGTVNDANFLVRGTAFQDANDFIIWDAGAGVLSYDADGSGAGAPQPIALLTPNTNLHASDILVV